jgi:co-chaperonin GroES (HSP10)
MAIVLNAKTVFDQVMFKIVPNPTIQLKTKSGIITNSGLHQSQETGKFEDSDNMIGFGIVTTTGPDCKAVKPGDALLFYRGSIRPVPIGEEIWQVSERNVMAYVDKDDPTLALAFEDYAKQTAVRDKELKETAHKLNILL